MEAVSARLLSQRTTDQTVIRICYGCSQEAARRGQRYDRNKIGADHDENGFVATKQHGIKTIVHEPGQRLRHGHARRLS